MHGDEFNPHVKPCECQGFTPRPVTGPSPEELLVLLREVEDDRQRLLGDGWPGDELGRRVDAVAPHFKEPGDRPCVLCRDGYRGPYRQSDGARHTCRVPGLGVMPSFVGEPPLLLAADGAVLWRPWEERGADIQGRWAEDGSPYTVDVPAPLQGVLLNLQRRLSAEWNRLYDGAARLRTRPVAQPPEDVDGLPLQVAELHGCLAGWVEGAPDINFDSPGNRGWLGALQKRSAAALEASRKTVARLRAAGRLLVAVLLLAAIGHADDAVPHAWPYYPDPAARARLAVLDATPDTRTVTDAELCRAGSTRDARLVTASMKTKVFQAYGITKDFGGYEIDHFISLELGGANALSNLWPQPYGGVSFTARMKDVVETSLHRRACRGELTFDAAREVIRTDWIAEYQRVMATRKAKPAKRTK